MVTNKQRLECGVYGLVYQYGDKARELSQTRFSKEIDNLTQEELNKLAEELHKTRAK